MIRAGKLCKACTATECKDLGTDAEPIEIECPDCAGNGCGNCTGGVFFIDGCPNDTCRELIPVLDLIDLFRKGLPPVDGGALDQSAWFIDAAKYLQREEAEIKAET